MVLRRLKYVAKYLRIATHWLARVGLVLLFSVFGLLFYMQTPGGRQTLADLVATELSGPTSKITIATTGGVPPRSIRFKTITIADSKGVWARIGAVDLVINPLDIFQGRLDIEALRFQKVEILRQPEPSEPDLKPFSVPNLPVAVRVVAFGAKGVRLDKAVAGVPANMTITGQGLWKGRELTFDLDILRTDAKTDQIKAVVKLEEDNQTHKVGLDARLNLRGDPDGVFAGLAGLKPGMGLTAGLEGKGPLDGWSGKLDIKAGGLATLGGDIKVTERSQNVAVGFKGVADLAPIIPKDVATRLGSKLTLDGEALVARGLPLGLRLEASNKALVANIASPGERGAEIRHWRFDAKILEPAYFKGWIAPATMKAASAKGEIEGSLRQPHLKFDAQIDKLTIPQLSVARIFATGDLKLVKTKTGWSGGGQLNGRLSDLSLLGGESRAARLDKIDFVMESGLDPALNSLIISRLDLKNGSLKATGSGKISLKGGERALRLQVNAADLGHFETLAGRALKGGVVVDLVLDQQSRTAPLMISGHARGHGVNLGNDTADKLLGPEPEVAFEGSQVDKGIEGKLSIKGSMLRGEMNGALSQGALDHSRFYVEVTDVPGLGALIGMPLPPAIRLDGTAQGRPADLFVEGKLTSADLIRKRLKLTNIRGQFAFKNLGQAPQGQVSFDMKLPAGDLHAAARMARHSGGGIQIDGISITAPETVIKGNLIQLPGQPLEGLLTGKSTNLKILARQFDLEADGTAEATLSLKNKAGRQRIEMTASGQKLASVLPNRDVIKMDKLTLMASAYRDAALHDLDLDLMVSGVRAATAEVTSLTFKAKGQGRAAHYELALQGNFRGGVSVISEGDFTDLADGFDLVVNKFDGTVYDRPLVLNKPLTLVSSPGKLTVAPLDLTLGKGHLEGNWRQGPEGQFIDGSAQNIDLILLSLLYPEAPINGQGDATASIRVVQGQPAGVITVSLHNVGSALKRGGVVVPANATLEARIARNVLLLKGRIIAPDKLDVTLGGNLPLRVNTARQTVSLAMDEPVSGQIDWKGEIATLWRMTPPSDHLISGNLEGRVLVAGTLHDPSFQGRMAIRDGGYDSLSLGLVARQIQASLAVNGRRVTIASAEASDASGGSFRAAGWIDLRPDQRFPAAIDLTLDKARIIRTSDLKAAASAVLAYSRAVDHAALSGDGEAREVDGNLVRRLPPEVPEIEVTEINLPPEEAGGAKTRIIGGKTKAPYPTNLNVHVKAPRRVFVRGRGLDSEWKGDLIVEGTYKKPSISGDMSLVRGTFTLGGKEFTLTDGTLAFTTGDKVDPLVNIRAEYKMTDLTAILQLTGPASKPLIKLTSTPELPQEEVMSRILFGTSVAQLGPLEAVQLGGAVASLSGSGGGLDLMNIARTTLGLDRLRFQSATDRSAGSLIAGGKYLTNNIYLEVETATGTGQSTARVKVNITDNLSVESDVGSANSSGVALKWEKEY